MSEMRTHQQATTRLSVTVSAKERELASLHAEIASLHAKSGKSESRVEGMKERLDQATADADEWRSKAGEVGAPVHLLCHPPSRPVPLAPPHMCTPPTHLNRPVKTDHRPYPMTYNGNVYSYTLTSTRTFLDIPRHTT